ncbi:MAG: VacB/RNase II family 3'-5' exoribonuclease [Planctomycetes bacterium]|nr:VacB/RNase II family 3'-5' exoribonuclease [Planctomycetota bacterium]MCB9909145.1 VacB/RNase II family 3'-5' exoribonuclease [Planctomycetota bacterium]
MAQGKGKPPGEGEFKSFADLIRSRGGEPKPAEDPTEGRGWMVDGQDERFQGEELDLLPDLGAGPRARIAARPRAIGAMDTGPPFYRDADSEEMGLLRSFRVRTVFLPDVMGEVEGLPADPRPSDAEGRQDLRGATIFTIDGKDARDYDDAIAIEALGDGRFEVGVHIADVSHYVRPQTRLDDEALARGTSVYLPDQVVPMLPEALSNGLCSLVPDRDRLAISVHMVFNAQGERESYRVAKSILRSVRRCTYQEVQELLDGADTEGAARLEDLRVPLEHFQVWTRRQQSLRDAKGSLRIDSRERKFVFGPDHEVQAIVDYPKYFSNTLIEETALAANQAVGDYFRERGLPTIYRVHPEKDPEEIERIAKMLEEHGLHVPLKDRLTGRDVGRLIRAARRKPNAEALIPRIMGLVERALYEVKDHEDVAQHFGLAREAYLHFTSPIRRYPDLIVHRWLSDLLARGEEAEAELRGGTWVDDLTEVAGHCSLQSEMAAMAETAVGDLKVCQFMAPHVGTKHEGRVVRVSRGGIEVHLPEFHVGGFLPLRAIGARPKLKGPTLTVQAGRRSLSFTEGYPIAVRIQDVDFLKLQVLMELG